MLWMNAGMHYDQGRGAQSYLEDVVGGLEIEKESPFEAKSSLATTVTDFVKRPAKFWWNFSYDLGVNGRRLGAGAGGLNA
jgi:hypothetical protein